MQIRYKCLKNNVFVSFFITSLRLCSYSVYTSVSDQRLIKWSCRLLVNHHILNRMNSPDMALYIFCRQLFHPEQQWWNKRKTTGDFLLFRSLWYCLNLGCEIKDILLMVDCCCQLVIVVRGWFISYSWDNW